MDIQRIRRQSDAIAMMYNGFNVPVEETSEYADEYVSVREMVQAVLLRFGTFSNNLAKPDRYDFTVSRDLPGDRTIVIVSFSIDNFNTSLIHALSDIVDAIEVDYQITLDCHASNRKPVKTCVRRTGVFIYATSDRLVEQLVG